MDENVWAITAPDEAVSLGIVKPFHSSLHFACPPDRDIEILLRSARLNNPNAVKGTNCAECTRIACPVNRTIVSLLEKSKLIPAIKSIQRVFFLGGPGSERNRK